MKKLTLIYILFIVFLGVINGQEANPCKKSTEGIDFWFGFIEGRHTGNNHFLEITVTAREASTFTITIGNSATPYGTYNVGSNSSTPIIIDWPLVEAIGSETIENKAIHLSSEKPVNVYALNFDRSSADVALIYPTQSLGNEYYAMTYTPDSNGNTGRNSEFMVVATEDSTMVEITPTVNTDNGQLKNSTDTIFLSKGQLYQVQANDEDLTGSFVKSDKPVAFFAGSHGTRIPSGYCCWDHLYEQIPPIHSWGREYYAVPLKSREQDRYRIMAAKDETTIYINGVQVATKNKGEFIEKVLYHNQPSLISADKPILVAQFSQSRDVDNSYTGGNGDPFMIILSSISQTKNDVTFVAYRGDQIKSYYLNIISLTEEIGNIRINDNVISNSFSPFPNSEYSYAQVNIGAGSTNRLYNNNPDRGFLAYVYGYGGVESYGYGVGFNLDLVLDIGESIDFNGDTLLLCHGESITLDAGPYFDNYYWESGDTTQTVDVYTEGNYKVRTTTVDGCQLEDSIYVYLSHPETDLGVNKAKGCYPFSVPLDGGDDFEKYVWQNQNNDTLSTNQYYTADKTDEYRITVYNEYNCPARDTMNMIVFPVPTIEIEGGSLICGVLNTNLSVKITDAPESVWNYDGSYSWSSEPKLRFSEETHESAKIEAPDWGEYTIFYQLRTTDGCSAVDTFSVRFHPQPESKFYFEDDLECEGYSKKLIFDGTATEDAIYFWDLDGCQFVDTIIKNQIYDVSVGAYLDKQPYIKLVINDNNCWSDTTEHPLGAKPNFKMTADNLRGCDSLSPVFTCELLTSDKVEYLWTFGDGTMQTIQNPIKNYPDTGFYDVSLTITNPITHCKNGFTYSDMVKIFPTPTAHITADASLCYPDSAQLIYTHNIDSSFCTWNFEGAHQSGTGNDTITMILDAPKGKAILTVNEYDCPSLPFRITLKRLPHFDFDTDFYEGCQPLASEVTAESEDSQIQFTWLTDSLPHPTGNSTVLLFPDSGRMDIGVIASSQETECFDTLIKADWIWVHPKPLAAFEVDYPVALLEHSTITYTNLSEFANYYFWDFGDNFTSVEENPMHTYTELGEFNTQLFADSEFECKDTTEFLIIILPFSVFTPNAFRPDSEIEKNRTFMPVGVGADASRFDLKVYDRWGIIIFETNSPDNPWDGKTKSGEPAPMGNYVWISHYFDIQGFEHNQKGQVVLVR